MTTHELTEANPGLQEEIAQRKQAEEALRQQTEYMAALHSTTLGLISRLDLDGGDLLAVFVAQPFTGRGSILARRDSAWAPVSRREDSIPLATSRLFEPGTVWR